MKAAREAWSAAQPDLAPERLVFVDETAANTKMARRSDGRRAAEWPCRTGTTRRPPSPPHCTPPAPRLLPLFDGATNGVRFRAYVADTLAPVLRRGDTVILGVWSRDVV